MKTLIVNLRAQLVGYAGLAYASDSGYVGDDVMDLVQIDKFPFFNIVPGNKRIVKADNVPITEIERHIMPVTIQFATRSMNMNVAILGNDEITGILDFADDLWDGVKSDKTVSGAARGLMIDMVDPDSQIEYDMFPIEGERGRLVIGAEMYIEFYKEICL